MAHIFMTQEVETMWNVFRMKPQAVAKDVYNH